MVLAAGELPRRAWNDRHAAGALSCVHAGARRHSSQATWETPPTMTRSAAPMPELVATRSVGRAAVSVISEGAEPGSLAKLAGVEPAAVRAAVPEATADGDIVFAFTVTLVRLGGAAILVDAGIGEPTGRLNRATWTPGLAAGLASLGLGIADVTHVVLTHAHWDHVDGALVERDARRVPRFPNARYLIGRADLDVGRAGTHPHNLCTPDLEALEAAGVLDLVDGDHAVVPGATMLDAPGETPGHHCLLVESDGESFIHLGDLYHHPAELAQRWTQVGTDAEQVFASRARILREALRRGATVVATHTPPPSWSRVVETPDGLRVVPAG